MKELKKLKSLNTFISNAQNRAIEEFILNETHNLLSVTQGNHVSASQKEQYVYSFIKELVDDIIK